MSKISDRIKRKFQERLKNQKRPIRILIKPVYDEVYFEGVEYLNSLAGSGDLGQVDFYLPAGLNKGDTK